MVELIQGLFIVHYQLQEGLMLFVLLLGTKVVFLLVVEQLSLHLILLDSFVSRHKFTSNSNASESACP